MNDITSYIQPLRFQSPNMNGYMPVQMPFLQSIGRNEIMTIVMISAIVVIVLFIVYKNLNYKNVVGGEEDSESFKNEHYQDMDPLTKCGWEVYVTNTCPYCVKQKQILNEHYPTFNNIYTDRPVTAVPTWYNTKTQETKTGMQTYESLLAMTKC